MYLYDVSNVQVDEREANLSIEIVTAYISGGFIATCDFHMSQPMM